MRSLVHLAFCLLPYWVASQPVSSSAPSWPVFKKTRTDGRNESHALHATSQRRLAHSGKGAKAGEAKRKKDDTTLAALVLRNDLIADLGYKLEVAKKRKANLERKVEYVDQRSASEQKEINMLMSQISALNSMQQNRSEQNSSEQPTHAAQADQKVQLDAERRYVSALNAQLLSQDQTVTNLTQQLSYLAEMHSRLVAQYEDPSLQHFLARTAVKAYHHPGIEGAANKTYRYVLPRAVEVLSNGQNASERMLNTTRDIMKARLTNGPLHMGSEHVERLLPLLSGFLVYGMLLLPFLCGLCCLTTVLCSIKFQTLLRFSQFYLSMVLLCASCFAGISRRDPLLVFVDYDVSLYLFVQAAFALILFVYIVLLLCAHCFVDDENAQIRRWSQLISTSLLAAVYFRLVWTPAMIDEDPEIHSFVGRLARFNTADEAPLSPLYSMPYVAAAMVFLVSFFFDQKAAHAAHENAKPE